MQTCLFQLCQTGANKLTFWMGMGFVLKGRETFKIEYAPIGAKISTQLSKDKWETWAFGYVEGQAGAKMCQIQQKLELQFSLFRFGNKV